MYVQLLFSFDYLRANALSYRHQLAVAAESDNQEHHHPAEYTFKSSQWPVSDTTWVSFLWLFWKARTASTSVRSIRSRLSSWVWVCGRHSETLSLFKTLSGVRSRLKTPLGQIHSGLRSPMLKTSASAWHITIDRILIGHILRRCCVMVLWPFKEPADSKVDLLLVLRDYRLPHVIMKAL